MARRERDYKKEYQRRQQLARQRGWPSYYQQRRLIELGFIAPYAPNRVRSIVTKNNQRIRVQREAREAREYETNIIRGGRTRYYGLNHSQLDRAFDWSAAHAGRHIAKYDYPENALPGVTEKEYLSAYSKAFVSGPQRYGKTRKTGGSPALYHYFVTITGYYTADEYESRYGPQAE